jgi:hypothetical protein
MLAHIYNPSYSREGPQVQGQLGNFARTCLKNKISYLGGGSRRILSTKPAQAKLRQNLSQTQNINKRAGGMVQLLESLVSLQEALGTISEYHV